MSWDDEDFDIAASSSVPVASWEDEAVDDDPVLESWDVDSDEEREKEKAKKNELAALKSAQKAKLEAKKKGKEKTLLEIDLVDEKTRKEMLRKQELDADLNNAADLFDGLGVADHPRARAAANSSGSAVLKLSADTPLTAHPLFSPTSKADYEKLRKALGSTMKELSEKSTLFYANSLAIDLTRDICEPLSIEQIRKVISTLNALVTQKVKEERTNRLKKTGGTSLGGAGKKKVKTAQVNTGPSSFKKDNLDDFMGGDDGLSDDDFM